MQVINEIVEVNMVRSDVGTLLAEVRWADQPAPVLTPDELAPYLQEQKDASELKAHAYALGVSGGNRFYDDSYELFAVPQQWGTGEVAPLHRLVFGSLGAAIESKARVIGFEVGLNNGIEAARERLADHMGRLHDELEARVPESIILEEDASPEAVDEALEVFDLNLDVARTFLIQKVALTVAERLKYEKMCESNPLEAIERACEMYERYKPVMEVYEQFEAMLEDDEKWRLPGLLPKLFRYFDLSVSYRKHEISSKKLDSEVGKLKIGVSRYGDFSLFASLEEVSRRHVRQEMGRK